MGKAQGLQRPKPAGGGGPAPATNGCMMKLLKAAAANRACRQRKKEAAAAAAGVAGGDAEQQQQGQAQQSGQRRHAAAAAVQQPQPLLIHKRPSSSSHPNQRSESSSTGSALSAPPGGARHKQLWSQLQALLDCRDMAAARKVRAAGHCLCAAQSSRTVSLSQKVEARWNRVYMCLPMGLPAHAACCWRGDRFASSQLLFPTTCLHTCTGHRPAELIGDGYCCERSALHSIAAACMSNLRPKAGGQHAGQINRYNTVLES